MSFVDWIPLTFNVAEHLWSPYYYWYWCPFRTCIHFKWTYTFIVYPNIGDLECFFSTKRLLWVLVAAFILTVYTCKKHVSWQTAFDSDATMLFVSFLLLFVLFLVQFNLLCDTWILGTLFSIQTTSFPSATGVP